ncbi:MAG: flagellar protein FlbB [Spirochaetes bacterium]|nr:flagellar protein FlbB [Spirochaetota bacterium]
MASFGKQRVFGRIVLMILLLAAIVIGGLFWFDYLGILDAKAFFAPALRLLRLPVRSSGDVVSDSPGLLDEERFVKQLQAIEIQRQELAERERLALEQDAELLSKAREIEERQKNIEEQQKSFNSMLEQYENRRANIEQNARYLGGMPPADAVNILAALDDQTAIDVLRSVEEIAQKAGETSVVAFWLSLMPPERAATLQRKMTEKPTGLD